jgi:hypothetical protein
MIMPDDTEIRLKELTYEEAKASLREYIEVMENCFCPIIQKACKPNCMFFDEGSITTCEERGLYMKLYNIEAPKCTYGRG